ncbi:hypothetical protein D3C71_1950180 [compost metagenome]
MRKHHKHIHIRAVQRKQHGDSGEYLQQNEGNGKIGLDHQFPVTLVVLIDPRVKNNNQEQEQYSGNAVNHFDSYPASQFRQTAPGAKQSGTGACRVGMADKSAGVDDQIRING